MNAPTGPGQILSLVIPPELAGQRLDRALAALLPGKTRAFLKKLFDRGAVGMAGSVAKPALRVRGGETLEVFVPDATPLDAAAEDIPLEVLYEDDDLVVIDKRPGMVAHPSQGHRDGTLVNALLHHYGDSLSGIGGVLRPGIVHRLDKDTTGCLVAAKNDDAHRALIRQFMEREVEKTYLALTEGSPRPVAGTVEGNIGRSRSDRKLHAMLASGGRHSVTHYRTLENYGMVALVECRLMTGRTHQARVHMAHKGAPILCDREYGKREAFTTGDLDRAVAVFQGRATPSPVTLPGSPVLQRQGLHAWRLGFRHPVSGRELSFEAPVPQDMLEVLAPLRAAFRSMENGMDK